jgi:transglutaminase-like putative cysteine protease
MQLRYSLKKIVSTSAHSSRLPIAAAVDRLLDVSLFALVVTGFVAVTGTGKLDLFSIVLVTSAILVRGYLFLRGSQWQLSVATTTRLTIFYALLYVVDFFALSGSFISATVHMVLFILVVKLFSVHSNRDRLYLAVISFLLLLAAAILTIDTLFLAAFIIFSLIAVVAFIAMEMRRSMIDSVSVATTANSQRLWRPLALTAFALIVSIMVLTPALFFLLPRRSMGRLSQFAQQNTFSTGFGDEVTLGQIGRIQQSDRVVMRVQFERTPPTDLKFHGITLAHFDGRRWSNRITETQSFLTRGGLDNMLQFTRGDLRKLLDGIGEDTAEVQQHIREHKAISLNYRVTLEPVGMNIFFFPARLKALQGTAREYMIDNRATLTYADPNRIVRAYSGLSLIQQHHEPGSSASADGPPLQTYLQLPAIDPRVVQLAKSVTAASRTPLEKAVDLERYLQKNYGYTLELQGSADPISFFLFQRKKGHCEYFASSMAVMLRSIGIPSRIVNGFRNGEQSEVTGSYIIRGRDAHSWVEAFIPGQGWVEFDPTPAGDAPAKIFWSRVNLYLDAAREFWGDWIINYDIGHQTLLADLTVTSVRQSSQQFWKNLNVRYSHVIERLRNAISLSNAGFTSPKAWITLLGSASVLISGAYGLSWTVRHRRLRKMPPKHFASIWFRQLVKKAARRGIRKEASQTAAQWAESVSDGEVRHALKAFIAEYENARFGASKESAEKLPELFEEAERTLKK